MTFEEFFKKKKINLLTLEQGEPGLFSEFRAHYDQMGEKSFDHTKKYWFNKLRLRFPAPVEIKVEKVVIENRLAEQTITEALTESAPVPNIGFKPKFRPGVTKPAETAETPKEGTPNTGQAAPAAENTTDAPKAALGFKPKFKAGITKAADTPEPSAAENTPDAPKPALGFKPKFKAGVTKPAETATEPEKTAEAPEEKAEAASPPPVLGFKPKFRAGVTKTVDTPAASEQEKPADVPEEKAEAPSPPPALGFKPKFRAGVTKPAEPSPEQNDKPKEE